MASFEDDAFGAPPPSSSGDAFGAPPPSGQAAPPPSLGPFSSGAAYAPAAEPAVVGGGAQSSWSFGAPPPPTGPPSAEGIGEGIRPPNWIPDDQVECCMGRNCGAKFTFWKRRHHCRLCGNVFCGDCTEKRAMMPDVFGTKDPQRVCEPCYAKVEPFQEQLAEANANALRENEVDDGSLMRYFNSPTRFTLGGEVGNLPCSCCAVARKMD